MARRESSGELSAPEAARRRALRWLAIRERSEHEVSERLRAAGFPPDTTVETVRGLVREGLLSDHRTALGVAEAIRRRGHGSLRARRDLERRGIARDLAVRVLGEVFADEEDLLRQVFLGRFPQLPASPSEKGRALRFLCGRGFPEELVLAIVERGC